MVWRNFWTVATVPALVFAAFSSSTNYQLKSYDLGPGASNSSASATYHNESTVGEPAGTSSSTNYKSLAASVQAQQANVPLAPTLSNGGNTYYNEINCIINTASNPTDTTYAIAVSTNGFVTTNYVQANGTLGGSPVYQTYTLWGSGSGTLITGLAQSTTYQVKVAAMQGMFTNSAYGPSASIATVASSITFNLSPNTEAMPTLTAGTVVSSPSNIVMTLTTNADYGGNIYIAGANGGLKSARTGHTIATGTYDLSAQTEGFGAQSVSATQTSGGPLTVVSPYNGTSNNVGPTATTFQPMYTTANPIVSGTANAVLKAKASTTTPASPDYQEVLTIIASASF